MVDDRQRHYLTHMAHEITAARRLAAAHTAESFFRDEIAIAALERFIERISEASRRIDASLKLLEPAVPWSDIAGIGNILRHDYDSIDLTILWNIAIREMPQLEAAIERLLQSIEPSA
jgi:uncharacterized protein with HEPN domain